jgi:protein SCO1/2
MAIRHTWADSRAVALLVALIGLGGWPAARAMDHAHHQQMLEQAGYVRTEHAYRLPDVTLKDQDGKRVSLRSLLDGEQQVLLNFIYTSCSTICPVLSASFTQAQRSLGAEAERVSMISISIDPEHDTPEVLRAYARRFHARAGWRFLTGDRHDIVAVLKAFDAYRRDKMNHMPLTLVRRGSGEDWIRLDGFPTAGDLARELHAPES